jgi:hypothetical protein
MERADWPGLRPQSSCIIIPSLQGRGRSRRLPHSWSGQRQPSKTAECIYIMRRYGVPPLDSLSAATFFLARQRNDPRERLLDSLHRFYIGSFAGMVHLFLPTIPCPLRQTRRGTSLGTLLPPFRYRYDMGYSQGSSSNDTITSYSTIKQMTITDFSASKRKNGAEHTRYSLFPVSNARYAYPETCRLSQLTPKTSRLFLRLSFKILGKVRSSMMPGEL